MSGSTIQIILYIVAGVLAIVGILNKSKDDKKHKQYDKIFIVGIILTLGFSILLEAIKANDEKNASELKEKQHKESIVSLTQLIEKSDRSLNKMDSTLRAQASIQKRTDSLLQTTNQISKETQSVLTNTVDVLKYQQRALDESEKERSPLFPLELVVIIKLPFNHEIFNRVIDTFWNYKKTIEEGQAYDAQNISIERLANSQKIKSINFSKYEKFFMHESNINNRLNFILNKEFYIGLFSKFNGDVNKLLKSTPIFSGFTHPQLISSWLTIDFENKSIYLTSSFNGIWFAHFSRKPIGISDLFNNYLVITPKDICNCEVTDVYMEIGKGINKSGADLKIRTLDGYPYGGNNCKTFVRKIEKKEIWIKAVPSN